MRSTVLAVLVFVSNLAAADSVTLTQVYRGHGAADYNKWLYSNAKDYEGLEPIHVQIDSSARRDTWQYSYYVSFLNGRGGVARRRTFSGERERDAIDGYGWFSARTSSNGDALFVSPERGLTMVYDKAGDSMFTSAEGSVVGEHGLYFRQFVDDQGGVYRDYFEVLGPRGTVLDSVGVGSHNDGGVLRTHPLVYSRNTTSIMRADTFVIVVSRTGRVLWKAATGDYAAVALSADGNAAAVATPESLVVRDLINSRGFVVKFEEARILDSVRATGDRVVPRGPFAMPLVALSNDGSKVAVFRTYNMGGTGAGLLDVFTGLGRPLCQGRYLTPGLTQRMGFAGDGVVFVGDARPVTDSIAFGGPGHPRRPSSMVHWLITRTDLCDSVTVKEVTVERTAVPKLTPSAVAFYGRDSIYVYRIRSTPSRQRK